LYYHARFVASHSAICGTNAAYFIKAQFLGARGLLIVDEAHGVPEWCVGQITTKIKQWDVNADEWPPVTTDFDSSIDWVIDIAKPRMVEKHRVLDGYLYGKPAPTHDKQYFQRLKEYSHLEYVLNNINRMVDDYEIFHEEWIMKLDKDSYGDAFIEYTPITSTRFLSGLLWSRGEKVIVSSGTISPDYYRSEAGLGKKTFDAKDCVFSVKSPFDSTRSPIYYIPVGKMSFREKDKTRPLVMQEINNVISRRQDRRGIIHTFTYDNAKYVQQHITKNIQPLLVMQDHEHRDDSLKAWLADPRPASVFVSTAMTEGIDLKDDLCRYQIYMKIGYLPIGDPRVAKRLHLGHNKWYKYQAIEDIEQASGRATRSANDWSEMFIFDSCFGDLKRQSKKYFKDWFLERVNEHQTIESLTPIYYNKIKKDGD
jgi:Rad3-related DNA helicase